VPFFQAGRLEEGGGLVVQHSCMDPPVGGQLLLHRLGHTQVGVRALPVLLLVPGQSKRVLGF
jgi:hypothetical protein